MLRVPMVVTLFGCVIFRRHRTDGTRIATLAPMIASEATGRQTGSCILINVLVRVSTCMLSWAASAASSNACRRTYCLRS